MCVEFTHQEVVRFLATYHLFSMTAKERFTSLLACGEIEDDSFSQENAQKYNAIIAQSVKISDLLRNEYLEQAVKVITGNNITIIDHSDATIKGTACQACQYIVFESKEDSFFEICPVCTWQNDGTPNGEISSANHMTINDFKEQGQFKKALPHAKKMYVRVL